VPLRVLQPPLLLAQLLRRQWIAWQTLELERARQNVPAVLLHKRIADDEPTEARRRTKPVQTLQTLPEPAPGRVQVCGAVEPVALPDLALPRRWEFFVLALGDVAVHVRRDRVQHLSTRDAELGVLRAHLDHPWERVGDDADLSQPGVRRWRIPSLHPRSLGLGRPIAVASVEKHVPPEIIVLRIWWWGKKWVKPNNGPDDLD